MVRTHESQFPRNADLLLLLLHSCCSPPIGLRPARGATASGRPARSWPWFRARRRRRPRRAVQRRGRAVLQRPHSAPRGVLRGPAPAAVPVATRPKKARRGDTLGTMRCERGRWAAAQGECGCRCQQGSSGGRCHGGLQWW